jgi:sigma-B regulation protein RsbU (phosphoserine phosphatase)
MDNHDAKLLVVDDTADDRRALTMLLELEGYANVTTAKGGFEALELLQVHFFDLVFLDVMMPGVSGCQIREQLQAEGKLTNLPVIVTSEIGEFESAMHCITLGAEACLLKPVNPLLLKDKMNSSLERKFLRDRLNARLARIETELDDARQLQLSMMPAVFPLPTRERPIEIFGIAEPARELGGDLYDFYYRDDGRLCFIIGDVSDKGVPAALFMARTKDVVRLVSTVFRSTILNGASPAEIICRVNHELCLDNSACMFVTLFLGVIDTQSGELEFCNAGHNSPYLLHGAGGVTQVLGAKGPPIGVRSRSNYEGGQLRLDFGDGLFLFTDGVTDATNEQGDFFKEERLEQLLHSHLVMGPEAVISATMTAIRDFRRTASPADDITMLALRRLLISS